MIESSASVFMFVILVCVTIVCIAAAIVVLYLLFAHGKDIYDEFKRSGKWLK